MSKSFENINSIDKVLVTNDTPISSDGIFHNSHGSIGRYSENDMWYSYQPHDNLRWTVVDEVNEIMTAVDKYIENTTSYWYVNEISWLYDKYDRKVSGKIRPYKLSRPEITAPTQPTIEARWTDVKDFMLLPLESEDQKKLTLRQRLGLAATGGFSLGAIEFMLVPWQETVAAETTTIGGAALAGAGYVMYKTRNKRSKEQAVVPQADHRQLTEDQAQVVLNLSQTLRYAGSELNHWADDITETELKSALMYVGSDDMSEATVKLLRWIDEASFDKMSGNEDARVEDKKERALHYLNTVGREVHSADMDESFHLISKSGRKSAPLILLALIRMKQRGAFMTKYEKEFSHVDEIRRKFADVESEYELVLDSQQAIGESAYFSMRREELERQRSECMKEMALLDLRIAALAYAFDMNYLYLDQNYQPIETEAFQLEQLELWNKSIEKLCLIPLHELPAPMSDVVIRTTDLCLNMEKSGQFGQAAKEAVDYLHKINMYVHTEGMADTAWQHVDHLLTRQKALE